MVTILILVSGLAVPSPDRFGPNPAEFGAPRSPSNALTPDVGSFRVGIAGPTLLTSQVTPPLITLGPGTYTATDKATLQLAINATGNVLFTVYTDSICSTSPVFTNTKSLIVDSPTTYSATSDPFTVPGAGAYYWIAAYLGDANNTVSSTVCATASEILTVLPATPSVSTLVSPPSFQLAATSQPATDTASLLAGFNPGGTITFTVYTTLDCSGTPVFRSQVPVSGTNGNYLSGQFTATAANTYRWIADYSGDANNRPTTTVCGAKGETLTVTRASPTITTQASPAVLNLGSGAGTAMDVATVSGGFNPTGTLTFDLFLNDPSCGSANRVFTSDAISVSGNRDYTSNAYTPTAVGTYYWIASYTGDPNNNAFTGSCGANGETLTVTAGGPTLTTQVSPSAIMLGTSPPYTAIDTATLSGGFKPKGTITFIVFNTTGCTGSPIFTSVVRNVDGNKAYPSDPFTIPGVGTYYWIAAYSGDPKNLPITKHCGDPGETLVVSPATPSVGTQVSAATIILGSSPPYNVTDTATLSGGFQPTGTMTFTVFNTIGCSGSPVFTNTKTVSGNKAYPSDPFTIPGVGTYNWIAKYSGDGNNPAVTTRCGDPNEVVTAYSGVSPVASFTFSPAITIPNLNVFFDGSASHAQIPGATISAYTWTFGDGNDHGPTALPTANYSYIRAGRFIVTLTVKDTFGFTNSTSHFVPVDAPPVAAFDTSHVNAKVGRPFTFNASLSSDSDGNITSWTWAFGDGETGSGQVATHTYASVGSKDVTLTVVDNVGYNNSATKSILVVLPQSPTAAFTLSPAQPVIGENVTLNGSASSDADGLIVSYAWTFGDGLSGTGAIVHHRYATAGDYQIRLNVTDEDGKSSENGTTLRVVTRPVAAFLFAPTAPLTNRTVTFTAAGSSDLSGPVNYSWVFGDGTSGTGYEVNKTYHAAGTYNVTLTVTNLYGVSTVVTQRITVATPIATGTSVSSFALGLAAVLDVGAAVAVGSYLFLVLRKKAKSL